MHPLLLRRGKVKGEGIVVESARKIGDEWATVQDGRRAGWQYHPRARVLPQSTWRLWELRPTPQKTWGSPEMWALWEVLHSLSEATFQDGTMTSHLPLGLSERE